MRLTKRQKWGRRAALTAGLAFIWFGVSVPYLPFGPDHPVFTIVIAVALLVVGVLGFVGLNALWPEDDTPPNLDNRPPEN